MLALLSVPSTLAHEMRGFSRKLDARGQHDALIRRYYTQAYFFISFALTSFRIWLVDATIIDLLCYATPCPVPFILSSMFMLSAFQPPHPAAASHSLDEVTVVHVVHFRFEIFEFCFNLNRCVSFSALHSGSRSSLGSLRAPWRLHVAPHMWSNHHLLSSSVSTPRPIHGRPKVSCGFLLPVHMGVFLLLLRCAFLGQECIGDLLRIPFFHVW